MSTFINEYGATLLYTILTSILSYAFLTLKKEVKRLSEIHQRKEIVKTCILGLKHIYKDQTNIERYDLAVSNIKEIFDRRKLSISEFEIKLLINEVCEENDCSHIE